MHILLVEAACTASEDDWARKIGELYMGWYTFFITANLIVLGYFHSKDTKLAERKTLLPLCLLFAVLGMLGTASAFYIAKNIAVCVPRFSNVITYSVWANNCALWGIALFWMWKMYVIWKGRP